MSRSILCICLVGCLTGSAIAAPPKDEEILQAIDKGVEYLRNVQSPEGRFPRFAERLGHFRREEVGATALGGLALLESGINPRDEQLRKTANLIRDGVSGLDHTYSIALSIMFLDRYDSKRDRRRIQILGMRLVAGQTTHGGWSYHCPVLNSEQHWDLYSALGGTDRRGGFNPTGVAAQSLPPQTAFGDNSNTQFALLGLWVAARHGTPVRRAMHAVGDRFRATQEPDGGWTYAKGGSSRMAMTCAGLLALAGDKTALRSGKNRERQDTSRAEDTPVVAAARSYLDKHVKRHAEGRSNRQRPARNGLGDIYALWSMERVGMVFGWEAFGDVDWYRWGSRILIDNQRADGSWGSTYPGVVDTSFALLFLNRSDLTTPLRARRVVTKLSSSDVGKKRIPEETITGRPEREDFFPRRSSTREQEKKSISKKELPEGAAQLERALTEATGEQQLRIIERLQDGKGQEYTFALADAIARLPAEVQTEAREALAKRLARMKEKTLRGYLNVDDPELPRAAVRASALQNNHKLIPDLIELLDGIDKELAEDANSSLKSLTGRDFGPPEQESPPDWAAARERWLSWHKRSAQEK